MKKLLSMIAVSTLVGTSASNLKPLFISNVISHGFKSNKINNKNINIINENDVNPFEPAQINISIHNIGNLVIAPNETIFVGTADGVYKSTDGGLNFSIIKGISNITITNLATDKDGNVYAGTKDYSGDVFTIYKSNGTNDFLKINNFITAMSISSLSINNIKNNIYVGTNRGLYQYNPINLLLKINKPPILLKNHDLYTMELSIILYKKLISKKT